MGKLMSRMIKASVVSATTAMISNFLNLSETKVGKILGVAIPVIAFVTADDPQISDLLFDNSKEKRKKGKDGLFGQQEKDGLFSGKEDENEFFNIFGKDKGTKMSKFIAKESGATEEEVNGVLGMTMNMMEWGLGRAIEEEEVDKKGFNQLFKDEAEEQKKQMPSLFKMATKAIF